MNDILNLLNTNKEEEKEEERSNYEIQLELTERIYRGHFNSIEHLKRALIEAQKLYDQNDDTRIKQKCIEIRKTAQKKLTALENQSLEVTRTYLRNKRELEFLKYLNTDLTINS
ncbi:MAG TPA: hypothetical protein VJ583_02855 [Nitrososphaeraceae archaeon]|jgi:hypothetical protein|nr:hypothetical protein [Nitrososphaeraceae archaeon]